MKSFIPAILLTTSTFVLALPTDIALPGVSLVHEDSTPAILTTGADVATWFNVSDGMSIDKRQDENGRFRILLCADPNLKGHCVNFGLKPGSLSQNGRDHCWNMDGDMSSFNDVISSVQPLNGGAWFVWPDPKCKGDGLTFRGQVNDFGGTGLNDRISAISVTI